MKLTEALSGKAIAGAERSDQSNGVVIQRSRSGYHLTRYTQHGRGDASPHDWVFPNLYELLVFARTQRFGEVDPEASDWRDAS